MKEIYRQTLTNQSQTPYSKGGDNFMEAASGAIAEVAKVIAETTVKVATPTVKTAIPTIANAATRTAESISQIAQATIAPDFSIENLNVIPKITPETIQPDVKAVGQTQNNPQPENEIRTVAEDSPHKLEINEQASVKNETKDNNIKEESLNENRAYAEKQKKLEAITSDPEYLQILEQKTSQARAEGAESDAKTLQIEALAEYFQQNNEETIEETREEQKHPLTAEQKKAISKEFKNAFEKNYKEMANVTTQASVLAKSKANEIKLKEDVNATEEQKLKASELTAKLTKQYNIILDAFKDKEEHPELMDYLKEAPNNPEILKLLKKEKYKYLLKTILTIALVIVAGAGDKTIEETTKEDASPNNSG